MSEQEDVTRKNLFGTHSDMVVAKSEDLPDNILPLGWVLAKDSCGYYKTEQNHVDTGVMDPNRVAGFGRKNVSDEDAKAILDVLASKDNEQSE